MPIACPGYSFERVEESCHVACLLSRDAHVGHRCCRNQLRRILQPGDQHIGRVGKFTGDVSMPSKFVERRADLAARKGNAGNHMANATFILNDGRPAASKIAVVDVWFIGRRRIARRHRNEQRTASRRFVELRRHCANRKSAISRACASGTPRSGMKVPGLTSWGDMMKRVRFSRVFGNTPATYLRRGKSTNGGPT